MLARKTKSPVDDFPEGEKQRISGGRKEACQDRSSSAHFSRMEESEAGLR